MKGQPRPGGLNDPRGAANDADDGALADAALLPIRLVGV